ncbi:hypothetical protein DSM112329_03417 [Paraconexibacter sp. AEG42_29]|uniref:HTH araC/xylS-type domain-containing protein n=1 Tax=Paraconexibacter sp. AEG42_29 TaxID=2997339 RepID=A0AAU7AXV3_9ACTN
MYEVGAFRSSESASLGWESTVSMLHGAMRVRGRSGDAYAGSLVWQASPSYRVVRWRGAAEQLSREEAELSADPRATCEVLAPVHGVLRIESCGQRMEVVPGEMVLVPMDRPTICAHDDVCEAISFIAPAARVRSRQAVSDAVLRVDRRGGLGGVAWGTLGALVEQRETLDGPGFDAVCDRLLDLMVLGAAGADTGSVSAPHEELVAAVRREVRGRAGDVALDGAEVAAALGWSLRHVQSALARAGTTMTEVIRDERLDRARAVLADPGHHASISRVAAECGFSTHAMFSTAFRERFGMTPSEARPALR